MRGAHHSVRFERERAVVALHCVPQAANLLLRREQLRKFCEAVRSVYSRVLARPGAVRIAVNCHASLRVRARCLALCAHDRVRQHAYDSCVT